MDIDGPCGADSNTGTVTCSSPVSGSSVAISGWSIDSLARSESQVASVVVKIDGNPVSGNIAHTVNRSGGGDVCDIYSRPDCPNVGYSYSWDSTTVINGTHTVTVTATDNDGSLPSSVTENITVKNPVSCDISTANPLSDTYVTTDTSGLKTFSVGGVKNAKSMMFPTYSWANQTNDVIWYTGTKGAGDDTNGYTWSASVGLGSFLPGNPEYGKFDTDIYMYNGADTVGCVPISWQRLHPPVVQVTPSSLSFSTPQGSNPANQTLTIKNNWGSSTTTQDLTWSVTNTGSWLTVSRSGQPTSGTEVGGASSNPPLTVAVNSASLAVGTYNATATVTSNDPITPTVNIPVTLTVSTSPIPSISLSQSNMTFAGVSDGSTPAGQTFTVTNNGAVGSTLKWHATTDTNWCYVNGADSSGFFTGADLAQGAVSPNLTVTVGAPSNTGSPQCHVIVSDNGSSPPASNSPQQITVTYNVKPSDVGNVTVSLAACPSTSVNLTWTAAQSGSVAKTYNIYRYIADDSGAAALIANVSGLSYTDNPSPGTYYYWVETLSGGFASPSRVASVPASVTVSACVSVSATLTADSTSIPSGSSTVLHWTIANSTSAVITSSPVDSQFNNRSSTNTAGAQDNTSNLTANTTYTLTAQGQGGPVVVTVTVNVTGVPPPPPPPATVSLDNSTCEQMLITWSPVSGATSYKIYRNTTGTAPVIGTTAPTISPIAPQGGNAGNQTYTDSVPAGLYYYWVTAVVAGAETSAQAPNAPNSLGVTNTNPTAVDACNLASLISSDKDIISINGSSNPSNNCGSTDPLPSGTDLKLGDKLTFQINLCNDSGTGPASNITITENLTNLQITSGQSDFNASYSGTALTYDGAFGASCTPAGVNHYCAYGTAPNQTLVFNLSSSAYDVPTALRRNLTFGAQISVPGNFTGASGRLQNCFNASYYNGSSQASVSSCTPLLLFSTGKGVPTVIEVP